MLITSKFFIKIVFKNSEYNTNMDNRIYMNTSSKKNHFLELLKGLDNLWELY